MPFVAQPNAGESAATRRGRTAAVAAVLLITAAGGVMDAWVYLSHGHVFANAQTGNVVLMMIALAQGDGRGAGRHLPPLMAFVAGLVGSRAAGQVLKRGGRNSRDIRLAVECALLFVLGLVADGLADGVVTASVGFIAGVQITSLSHIGAWSFTTGMTTGNLRAASSALVKALGGAEAEWPHAWLLIGTCLAFTAGALGGAWATPRLGGPTLWLAAGLAAAALVSVRRERDPLPGWEPRP